MNRFHSKQEFILLISLLALWKIFLLLKLHHSSASVPQADLQVICNDSQSRASVHRSVEVWGPKSSSVVPGRRSEPQRSPQAREHINNGGPKALKHFQIWGLRAQENFSFWVLEAWATKEGQNHRGRSPRLRSCSFYSKDWVKLSLLLLCVHISCTLYKI